MRGVTKSHELTRIPKPQYEHSLDTKAFQYEHSVDLLTLLHSEWPIPSAKEINLKYTRSKFNHTPAKPCLHMPIEDRISHDRAYRGLYIHVAPC